ncbi:MAG: NADH-quinone oxidoreductase subunit C [Bacteroidales bacterium]
MNYISIKNGESIAVNSVPVLNYQEFYDVFDLLKDHENHCINYFAVNEADTIRLWAMIANDREHTIYVFSSNVAYDSKLKSLTFKYPGMHVYEREIAEVFHLQFEESDWDKPLRFPFNRKNTEQTIEKYPFYSIESQELHEVGVGPIHAGIIEPGHFRFICNGEKVLHLEIQLGFQHRGVESLMIQNQNITYQTKLSESISGDTVVGNTLAFANIIESLNGKSMPASVEIERAIALELERIAIHTGDLSALCTDVAYQFGTVVFQDLRTIIINTFLQWCGNRFARKLIQPLKNKYPLTQELKEKILANLAEYESRFHEMAQLMFNIPSVLARFENVGVVTTQQAVDMMFVGMAARTCGVERDIRKSHPHGFYQHTAIDPVVLKNGDVKARAKLRYLEIVASLKYIKEWLQLHSSSEKITHSNSKLMPNSLCVTLVEGWRGELCHVALTDANGNFLHYKIKDPSLHNWFALALAVRNNDISDFPICNKSFDLSYCGFDL